MILTDEMSGVIPLIWLEVEVETSMTGRLLGCDKKKCYLHKSSNRSWLKEPKNFSRYWQWKAQLRRNRDRHHLRGKQWGGRLAEQCDNFAWTLHWFMLPPSGMYCYLSTGLGRASTTASPVRFSFGTRAQWYKNGSTSHCSLRGVVRRYPGPLNPDV